MLRGQADASLLRSVLRQDPDAILVGEIRDSETARTAMQAAITGHLVFSTVHTTSTIGTVFRLSVGLGPFVKLLPAFGAAGAAVTILGTDLTGAARVTFDGKAAAFTVLSPTAIRTTVPPGTSTGTVRVVTPGGPLASNVAFQVLGTIGH